MEPRLGKIEKILQKGIQPFKILIMPDFTVDHLIRMEEDFESILEKMKGIAARGGGNIPFTQHSIIRGGNAANLASAIASLGLSVTFTSETDPLGKVLLDYFLGPLGVDCSSVTTSGRLSATVALEFKRHGRLTNIMISDIGSIKNYGFENVPSGIIDKLKKEMQAVAVLNWIQDWKGTELAMEIFKIAKENKVLSFLDTGDLSVRAKEIPQLIENLLLKNWVDIFGFNENEALWLASYFEPDFQERRKKEECLPLAVEAVRLLGETFDFTICMHTPYFAVAVKDRREYWVPAYDIEPLRATGSGDSWNAGFIAGALLGLGMEDQILLGHTTAGSYLVNPSGYHCKPEEMIRFLRERKLRPLMSFNS